MAAGFIGPFPVAGRPAEVHTSQKNALGIVARYSDGNEYIYLAGVASLAAGNWVVYQVGEFTAVRAAAGLKGSVAIATAAVTAATSYGWFLIAGTYATATADSTIVSNAHCFLTATAGQVDDAVVKNDQIKKARTTTAGQAAKTAGVVIDRPFVGSYDESA